MRKKIFTNKSMLVWRIVLAFVLFLRCFGLYSMSLYMQEALGKGVTLDRKNVSLKEVIWEMEKQTGIVFIYNSNDAENLRMASLKVAGKPVLNVLDSCLARTDMTYAVKNEVITISKKNTAEKTRISPSAPNQSRELSGYVFDGDNRPLYGATVAASGTQTAVITQKNGFFRITIEPGKEAAILVSFVGMQTQRILVYDRTNIDVHLLPVKEQLDEIVVTGYGNISKEAYTGSATVINGHDIQNRPVATFDGAIRGLSPGTIVTGVGQPGEAVSVRLRGIGSMNASNQPLYVIDGVVWDQDNISGGDQIPSNPMTTLNPSDIENISILKDAASASLYGAQGANGVIVITTKQGVSSERLKFTLSLQGGVAQMADQAKPRLVNGRQYAELWTEGEMHRLLQTATTASGQTFLDELKLMYTDKSYAGVAGKNYNEWLKQAQYNFNQFYQVPNGDGTYQSYDFFGADADKLPSTDWFDEISRLAPFQKYNLSLTGGGTAAKYYMSFEHFDQQGTIINSQLARNSGRFNMLSDNPKNWINWGTNVMIAQSLEKGPANGGALYNMPQYAAALLPAVVQPYATDGTYNFYFPNNLLNTNHNPLASAKLNIRDRPLINLNPSAWLQVNLLKWLNFKNTLTYYYLYGRRRDYFDKDFGSGYAVDGNLQERDSRRNKWVNTGMFNVNQTFNNKHRISASAGFEVVDFKEIFNQVSVNGFMTDENPYLSAGSEVTDWSGGGYAYAAFSIISRADYSYRYKYFLSGSFRRDKSSRFQPGYDVGNFWSASGAWRITNESWDWVKGLLKWVNNIRVKGSYGINGTLPSSYYSWQSLFNGTANYGGEHALYSSYRPASDLTWEKNNIFNIGLDIGFLENRFTISAEYYKRKTSDLLQNFPVSETSGYTNMLMNTDAGINNSGVEVDVKANVIDKRVKWDLDWNIATLKSTYTGLGSDLIDGSQIQRNGRSVYAWYLIEWAGINPETGNSLFYKYDDNGAKTPGEGATSSDRRVLGQGLPKVTGGLTSTLTFNGWELSALFTYAWGHDIFDALGQSRTMTDGRGDYSISVDQLDRWTPLHTASANAIRINGKLAEGSSSRYLYKGDYLKIRNVKIQYTFPSSTFRKMGVSGLSIFTQAENLHTWTALKDYDPEMQLNGYRYTDRYPTSTTTTVGVLVNF